MSGELRGVQSEIPEVARHRREATAARPRPARRAGRTTACCVPKPTQSTTRRNRPANGALRWPSCTARPTSAGSHRCPRVPLRPPPR